MKLANQRSLFTINESNENSLLLSSVPRNRKLEETPSYENTGFSKIPKFLTNAKQVESSTNKNNLFTNTVRKQNLESQRTPLIGTNSNNIMVVGFPQNSYQKVLNEFKEFGPIADYYIDQFSNWLVIKYVDPISAHEAIRNYNPYMLGSHTGHRISVSSIDPQDIPQQGFYNTDKFSDRPVQQQKQNLDISSPTISYSSMLIDLFLNW